MLYKQKQFSEFFFFFFSEYLNHKVQNTWIVDDLIHHVDEIIHIQTFLTYSNLKDALFSFFWYELGQLHDVNCHCSMYALDALNLLGSILVFVESFLIWDQPILRL